MLLENPAPDLSIDRLAEIARDLFGLEGIVSRLESELDLNALVETPEGAFALKVANSAEVDGVLEFEAALLKHLANGDPELPVGRVVPTLQGNPTGSISVAGAIHQVRAVTFLDGSHVPSGPLPPEMSHSIGLLVARLQRALRGFFHPGAGRRLMWDARQAHELVSWVPSIADPGLREVVGRILTETAESTVPLLAALPAQVIHHDIHRHNLLIDPGHQIIGVLDFGDAIHGPRVQDLAVAATYVALEDPDPMAAARAVVAGFCEVGELEAAEVGVLPQLVRLRMAQSLTIAAHRAVRHPANRAYITSDSAEVEAALYRWESLDRQAVVSAIGNTAAIPSPTRPSADLADRRRRHLWSGLRLSYREPLHLVRGAGVWLYDAAGTRYLDAYNNVAQVGHANRRVVAAATNQAARLNTNTRYLTAPVVELAERLAGLLPAPLEVCFFVNSGTEANELAWRIARTVTGNTGAIVTENAYHGWTGDVYALSPEGRSPEELSDTVATMAPPPSTGSDVAAAVRSLADRGHRPAAVWVDATFSSDGIHTPPAGYLPAAARTVRDHGGLFIADEVQGGLGRVGPDYWAFAGEGLIPDIVTLGKPLGNGYPIGAVVTTLDIAERFAVGGYFFSTFGGNPASAAAALAVLQITAELDLPGRAASTGARLRKGLAEVFAQADLDVDVRGRGAFIGLDLGTAAPAELLVEGMKAEGVLVGRTGPHESVVKIRPPLVFGPQHADQLVAAAAQAVLGLSLREGESRASRAVGEAGDG